MRRQTEALSPSSAENRSSNMSKPDAPKGASRPRLSTIDTITKNERSIRMDNASDVSDLQHVSLFDFGESEFELMHVTVTVHTLTGILSDRTSGKKKAGGLRPPKAMKTSEPPNPESSATSSLSSSSGPSYVQKDKIPTTAVASFGRNVCSSQTSIMTHLPSLPLGMPTASFGYVNRYMAQWNEPKPSFLEEEDEADPQSSFTFLRVMMRETMDLGEKQASTNISSYVHETVDIQINLSRGKEIIPLGVATLAITGDEEGTMQMSLPAKPLADQKKKGKRLFKKKRKHALSFPSDPSRKFFLDENATLVVSVVIIPQEAINDAKAREQARGIREQMKKMQIRRELEKLGNEENSIIHKERVKAKMTPSTKPSFGTSFATSFGGGTLGTKQTVPVLQPNLLCGSCNVLGMDKASGARSSVSCLQKEKECEDYSVDSSTIDNLVQEKFGYSMASSVLSSVSESESESDESEGDDVHLNRKIFVLK